MNKREKLKAAAWDATIALSTAANSRDLAWRFYRNSDNTDNKADTDLGWDAYVAAEKVFIVAQVASQRADIAYNAYKKYYDYDYDGVHEALVIDANRKDAEAYDRKHTKPTYLTKTK